jgi:hypothetical protein
MFQSTGRDRINVIKYLCYLCIIIARYEVQLVVYFGTCQRESFNLHPNYKREDLWIRCLLWRRLLDMCTMETEVRELRYIILSFAHGVILKWFPKNTFLHRIYCYTRTVKSRHWSSQMRYRYRQGSAVKTIWDTPTQGNNLTAVVISLAICRLRHAYWRNDFSNRMEGMQ